ncbi:MAG: ATP-binding protein, partial [Clostridia bacterium]|nr:ATP-binding protein [Clostridia bacterium]
TAALSLLIFRLFLRTRKMKDAFKNVRACRIVMTNNNRELATALAQVEEFCDENRIPPGKAAQIQLGVEELCAVTMQKAFTGRKDEYIQIVLVIEPGPQYVLHIRDSAPFFNPLDLRMEKAQKDMEASIMDSIGVMMVRRQSKFIYYRNYQGFNTMTVVYE